MSFIRKIKKKDAVYLAEVENYREGGKVKQRFIRYVGKEVNLQPAAATLDAATLEVTSVKKYLDYQVLHTIAQKLTLPKLLGEKARYILLLVYTQLTSRKPIYQIPQYVEHTVLQEVLGIDKLVDKQLYEALDSLEYLDFAPVEDKVFELLCGMRKEKSAMVLDVTDTYFNGSLADWKARKGKDGKYDKLLQISLAVTKEEGFPILHKVYEGNIGNVRIFADTLAEVRLKNFDIIILDRGMISAEILEDLKALGQKVITGLRLHSGIKATYISTINREEIYQPSQRVKLKNTEVFVQEFDYEGGKLLAIYNPELEILKRQHAMRDEDSYKKEEAKYMGYSLIYHTTTMQAREVVRMYFEKDIVEKAYRELKSTVGLHPVRKYRMNRIKAHVKICYLAYVILSYIQYRVKPKQLSATYVLEQLQCIYKVRLESQKDNLIWDKVVTLKNEQKKILQLLGCSV